MQYVHICSPHAWPQISFFFFLFSDTQNYPSIHPSIQNYFYVFSLTDKYCNLLKADYIFPSFIWTFLISLASSSAPILQVFETALASLCVCLVLVFLQSAKTGIRGHSQPWCSRVVEDTSEKSSIIRALIMLLLTSLLAINPIVS